jgi:hypothetical protein
MGDVGPKTVIWWTQHIHTEFYSRIPLKSGYLKDKKKRVKGGYKLGGVLGIRWPVKSTTDFTERRKFGMVMFGKVDTISYQTVYFQIL